MINLGRFEIRVGCDVALKLERLEVFKKWQGGLGSSLRNVVGVLGQAWLCRDQLTQTSRRDASWRPGLLLKREVRRAEATVG